MDTALFLYIAIHNDFCKYLTDRNLQRSPWMPFTHARSLRLECRYSQSLWISLTVQPCKFTLSSTPPPRNPFTFLPAVPPSASIPRLARWKIFEYLQLWHLHHEEIRFLVYGPAVHLEEVTPDGGACSGTGCCRWTFRTPPVNGCP